MRDFYVFDIPIYLTSKEKYYAGRDELLEKHLQNCFEDQGIPRPDRTDHALLRIEHNVTKLYGGPWEFNQIVGWVRLFIEGTGVGCHIWRTDAKRLHRRMRKMFYLQTMSSSLWTHFPKEDSAAIFRGTLEALEKLARRDELKHRHLDLAVFRRVGPFIDWRGLIDAAAERGS